MDFLEFRLLADGSSDRVLLPVLTWLLRQHATVPVEGRWADVSRLEPAPQNLAARIRAAASAYPCDLLCVHRDAENQPRDLRVQQIREALDGLENPPVVCVVPIRMTEAWLFIDEAAIRTAADAPNGRIPLDLPRPRTVEALPNPKAELHRLLRKASCLTGRRLRKFHPEEHVHRLGELIRDYAPLRSLSAFQALEDEVRAVLRGLQPQ